MPVFDESAPERQRESVGELFDVAVVVDGEDVDAQKVPNSFRDP